MTSSVIKRKTGRKTPERLLRLAPGALVSRASGGFGRLGGRPARAARQGARPNAKLRWMTIAARLLTGMALELSGGGAPRSGTFVSVWGTPKEPRATPTVSGVVGRKSLER